MKSRSRRPLGSGIKSGEIGRGTRVLNSGSLTSPSTQSSVLPSATRSLKSCSGVNTKRKESAINSSNTSPHSQGEVPGNRVNFDGATSASPNFQPRNKNAEVSLSLSPTLDCSLRLLKSNENKCDQTTGSSMTDESKKVKKAPKLAVVFSEGKCVTANDTEELEDSCGEGCEVNIAKLEKERSLSGYSDNFIRPSVPVLVLSDTPTRTKDVTAAIKIQRWFRRKVWGNQIESGRSLKTSTITMDSRKNSQNFDVDEVKVLLQDKKAGFDRSRECELDNVKGGLIAHNRKLMEKRQRRTTKLTAERKAAIEDLQRKREQKKKNAKLAEEEVVRIGATRKTTKTKKLKRTATTQVNTLFYQSSHAKSVEHTKSDVSGSPICQSQLPEKSPAVSTYEEIMGTLQLLEKVPSSLSPNGAPSTKFTGTSEESDKFKLEKSTGLSESKLQSILLYLDQVDKAEADRSRDITKSVSKACRDECLIGRNEPRQSNVQSSIEAASATVNDVTTTIVAQRMELDNKSKTIEMLQKALNQQRELTIYHAKEAENEGRKRLDLQKTEYESTIKRHQCFIDQLIDDKKVLGERCENLVKELKDLDKKHKAKLSSLEESHTADMNKLRQVTAAADKLRKEKWQSEEAQRIKEATVKGLEPEIQRIIAKGKSEIQKLKAIHEAELAQADERASRKFIGQIEELREQCALEKEQACTHEREIARQRYEKLIEQEEVNFQQQRKRLFKELAQEKEKAAEELQRQKFNFELRLKDNTEIHNGMMEELKIHHAKQLEELASHHKAEIHAAKDSVEAEHKRWVECEKQKIKSDLIFKENEIRKQVKEERNKDIEMVISRLEKEMAEAKEECDRAAEARIRRIKEKSEVEVREVERSEKSTLEKFNTMKSQVIQLDGEVARLTTLLQQRDQEVKRVGNIASKLTEERDRVSDIVRREFFDRLVSTEEENKDLKKEMIELRSRHKVELDRIKKSKDLELAAVHERVKQALEKKESNLKVLQEQYEGAVKRADHLQMLLQRQRNELLKK